MPIPYGKYVWGCTIEVPSGKVCFADAKSIRIVFGNLAQLHVDGEACGSRMRRDESVATHCIVCKLIEALVALI